jgi:hypothetical protein
LQLGLAYLPDARLREKVFLPGRAFAGSSFREMPLVTHTKIISLSFCALALVTWSSLVMDVQFRGVPPVRVVHRPYFPPYRRIENDKEKPTRRTTTLSMNPQTIGLINREATKHDVDKWMEDLFARIQLCVMHAHGVIQRDGTTNEEETMFEDLRTTEFPVGTQDHQLESTSCRR